MHALIWLHHKVVSQFFQQIFNKFHIEIADDIEWFQSKIKKIN